MRNSSRYVNDRAARDRLIITGYVNDSSAGEDEIDLILGVGLLRYCHTDEVIVKS